MVVIDDMRTVALHKGKDVALPDRHPRRALTRNNGFMPDVPGGIIGCKYRVDFTYPLQQMRDIRVLHKTVLRDAVLVARGALHHFDSLFIIHVRHVENINGQGEHFTLQGVVSCHMPAHHGRDVIPGAR